MGLDSQAIADTRVYAQDTEPSDTRDGILWVDTSVNPRETKVYSSESGSWEAIADISWEEVSGRPTETSRNGLSGGYALIATVSIPEFSSTTRDVSNRLNGVRITPTDEYGRSYSLEIRKGDGTNVYSDTGLSGVTEVTFGYQMIDSIFIDNSDSVSANLDVAGHTPALIHHSHTL